MTQRSDPPPHTPTRDLEDATKHGVRVTEAMLTELSLSSLGGDDTALVVTLSRAKHPTGNAAFAYRVTMQDNLDTIGADTVALEAIPSFLSGLDLPVGMRLEICRRIMSKEDPLAAQSAYTVNPKER